MKKKPIKGKPKVNPELEGFEIKINEFGEIISNYDMNKIYKFLNKHMDDKKLKERDGADDIGADDGEKKKNARKKRKKKK